MHECVCDLIKLQGTSIFCSFPLCWSRCKFLYRTSLHPSLYPSAHRVSPVSLERKKRRFDTVSRYFTHTPSLRPLGTLVLDSASQSGRYEKEVSRLNFPLGDDNDGDDVEEDDATRPGFSASEVVGRGEENNPD